jgi:hypothetical protein
MIDEVAKPRRRYGALSVRLALVTFTLAMMATMVVVQTSKTRAYDVVFPVFVVLVGLAAPAAHAIGVALGVGAIVRQGDQPGLGVLGVCLNALSMAIGIFLVFVALMGWAAFR